MSSHSEPKKLKGGMGGWVPVWFSMGNLAFWRSFGCGRFGCAGGGRDFAWLTLLLSLVIAMMLLMAGSRAGLLDRFTDALLGTLRPYGVPIWVTPHWENHEGIQKNLLDRLDKLSAPDTGPIPGLSVHSYRRLERGRPGIRLPGVASWKRDAPFIGWAVYPNNPLWQLQTPEGWHPGVEGATDEWLGLPLTIVLSETLFVERFNYDAYRESVSEGLRKRKRPPPPMRPPGKKLTEFLDTLWLSVTVSNDDQLLPFKVRWVHHIPAMEKVSYLFPLSTYHALLAAYHFPDLKYDPATLGRGDFAAHQVLMDPNYPRAGITAFAKCAQEEVAATGLTGLPTINTKRCPPPILPRASSQAGGSGSGGSTGWDTLNHDTQSQLWIPCHRLPRNDTLRGTLCPRYGRRGAPSDPVFVPWDVTSYGTSFSAVHVYVPDPTRINQGIEEFLAIRTRDGRPALNIHAMYMDALTRFNLLSDMLATLVPAYAITFGVFLAALLLAQVGALVEHRRRHFGILLSRGFTSLGIYTKLIWQMALSTLVGGALAVFGMVPLLRYQLEDGFRGIIEKYRDILPPGQTFEVLPLSPEAIAITIGTVFGAVVFVTIFRLFSMPLRGSTAPSDLLHGKRAAPKRDALSRDV
ncbi:MAG: ABC transporter permease [Magnetococcales bacterium]|nr:ABC transporter permease [Magnetococcales bacterium]